MNNNILWKPILKEIILSTRDNIYLLKYFSNIFHEVNHIVSFDIRNLCSKILQEYRLVRIELRADNFTNKIPECIKME